MYTVFLADDEQLIREGLEETIPWSSLGMKVIGTAEDGRQALKAVRNLKPDIVLTDIRMPYVDGLELISKIREVHPACRVVILTGHGEFSYAQAAIQLGVSDFLLKPIDVPGLCRILGKLARELDGERNQRDEVEAMRMKLQKADEFRLQRQLRRYMMGRTPRQQFLEQIPERLFRAKAMVLVLLQIDNFDNLTASMDGESIFSMTQKLEQAIEKASENLGMTFVEESSGRYLLLFTGAWKENLVFEVRSYIRRLRLVEPDLRFTTATSPAYECIENCQEAYEFVCRGCEYAFQLGSNQDIQPEEVKSGVNDPFPDIPNVGRVIRSIATFNKKTIRADFETLAKDIRQTGHNSYLYTHMLVSVVYGEIVKLLVDINCPIETILSDPLEDYRKILTRTSLDDMLQELYLFVAKICDFLEKNINANQSVAERAKTYIEGHFADSGLTLEQVAREMGITPNYFSALFKQNTGDSFINYLTNVRISHAKELLKGGAYKTYEIAMHCGYENSTYFSTIFKRRTGVSPSEYRSGLSSDP